MRKTIFFFITLFSSLVIANDEFQSIEELESFDGWLYESFFAKTPVTEKMILDIGKPVRITKSDYSVEHAKKSLRSVVYEFPGLEICALVEQNNEKIAHITRVKLQSKNWKLKNGISVGQSKDILASMPVASDEGTNEYCGVNNCINFEILEDRISEVEISLYAD